MQSFDELVARVKMECNKFLPSSSGAGGVSTLTGGWLEVSIRHERDCYGFFTCSDKKAGAKVWFLEGVKPAKLNGDARAWVGEDASSFLVEAELRASCDVGDLRLHIKAQYDENVNESGGIRGWTSPEYKSARYRCGSSSV